MSWAGPEDIFLSTSLASYLDKKLLVLLRDGRKLLGILRSFDQFANVVLEGACERVIVGDLYCDIPLGLYVIRGENVVLIGELRRRSFQLIWFVFQYQKLEGLKGQNGMLLI
ncbi:sm-like protein LSM1B isoform X2 [Zingiber officinale]|uniref:sm-like protein LSM1B isoform X2 n=1 Tax=Zingiber officinale TaxID=94328 RepID=UPI001C4B58F7|nr:sm-like protein LSM1B isoform X2 [Zingiber officinale]XP_042437389.1 sm-like protein LSM1B isoform X2 [Zingiber officinale]